MERHEYIEKLKTKFDISELVCSHVVSRFGEDAWRFFDDKTLQVLYLLRFEIFKAPIIINNGRHFTQRGLRCNRCRLVRMKTGPYLSSHVLGKGLDMDIVGYTAEQARNKVKANISMFPFPIKMEADVNWQHIDVIDMGTGDQLTMFTAGMLVI